jgi:dCTP deaminase
MILNDKQIMERCGSWSWINPKEWAAHLHPEERMIEPFTGVQVKSIEETLIFEGKNPAAINRPIISYGLSSFGYDVRLADEFKVFNSVVLDKPPLIDPKAQNEGYFVKHKGSHAIIPPNSFLLGHTIEYMRIPRDILVVCLGKSTYARCGLVVNVTPLEPEWHGQVTLEISNTTQLPAIVYANEGIAQFLFLQGVPPQTSYADRKGKYLGQRGVTAAKV